MIKDREDTFQVVFSLTFVETVTYCYCKKCSGCNITSYSTRIPLPSPLSLEG